MNKKIFEVSEIKDKILHAVDKINDPIRQTLSPRGSNVIYKDNNGNPQVTNDGFTIASNITVRDEIEDTIIDIIKTGSRKTNLEAGDGTSSTVLMSSVLIKEGLRLVDDGHNRIEIRDVLNQFSQEMIKGLNKRAVKIKDDEDIEKIARISASNDEYIAKNVMKIMKVVGVTGQVMIDRGYTPETEIIKDTGFVLSGIFDRELTGKSNKLDMNDVPIIITDKRLYYKAEAEKILSTVLGAGYDEVVIVAKDFIGESLPFFVANHKNSKVRCILVTEKDMDILEDLAIYVGNDVVSEKKGSLVDNISIGNFSLVKRAYSDSGKTIISRSDSISKKNINNRVSVLKEELKKISNKSSTNYNQIKNRISSLTSGMVTIRVGGNTSLEVFEKAHRYEDAVNACRTAMDKGYLPGAGVSVWEVYNSIENKLGLPYRRLFRVACEANIRQIAENCGKNPDSIIEKLREVDKGFGYNAVSGKIENVLKAGIIEPLMVATQVVANSISIANVIVTSRYLVVNDLEDYKKINKEDK